MPATGTQREGAFPVLRTPRLLLRRPEPHDAEALARIMRDPRVHRYHASSALQGPNEAVDAIHSLHGAYLAGQAVGWAIELHRTGSLIGTCGLYALAPGCPHAEVALFLDPSHWGRGIPFELAPVVKAFAREVLRLSEFHALVDPLNRNAIRVIQRIGSRSCAQADPGSGTTVVPPNMELHILPLGGTAPPDGTLST